MGAAAHEVNNALNGAVMNLEVVRLRAVAGRDAGAVAPFAAAAAAEQEGVTAMVGALLALARAPSGGRADVRTVAAATLALLGPVAGRHGVSLDVTLGELPAPTAAPELAVRLAVGAALGAALDLAGQAARSGEGDGAGDRSGVLRCNLVAGDGPALEVAPAPAVWPEGVLDLLATWDVRVRSEPRVARLMFPAP